MNATDPDRRHLHDLEDQLARMTTRAEKAEAAVSEAERKADMLDLQLSAMRSRARVAEAERSDCQTELWNAGFKLGTADRRIADLEAELAAHRAEAERPIVLLSRRVVDAHEGVRNSTEYGQWRAMDALGQAISDLEDALPDGSPVPEIGGGA